MVLSKFHRLVFGRRLAHAVPVNFRVDGYRIAAPPESHSPADRWQNRLVQLSNIRQTPVGYLENSTFSKMSFQTECLSVDRFAVCPLHLSVPS